MYIPPIWQEEFEQLEISEIIAEINSTKLPAKNRVAVRYALAAIQDLQLEDQPAYLDDLLCAMRQKSMDAQVVQQVWDQVSEELEAAAEEEIRYSRQLRDEKNISIKWW